MSRSQKLPDSFIGRLEAAGFSRADAAVLQPAEPFLDVMGEELRQRIFLTSDADGRELCLRPDFTIPTALAHISRGAGATAGRYFYEGPVFRQGSNGGESPQAGVEIFGDADALQAETEIVALALEASAALGVNDPVVTLGDRAIVDAAVDALDAPEAFRERLKRSLAHGGSIEALGSSRDGREAEHAGLFAALTAAGPEAGRAVIEDLLSLAGIAAVGGRTAGDIAERFLDRAASRSVLLPAEAKRTLSALIAVDAPARTAVDALGALAAGPVAGAVERLARRLDAFGAAGLPVDAMRFSARFGRNLDYYTGLVFELGRAQGGAPLAGGGRYDGLMSALGSPVPTPGVGFALWLDRFPEARP